MCAASSFWFCGDVLGQLLLAAAGIHTQALMEIVAAASSRAARELGQSLLRLLQTVEQLAGRPSCCEECVWRASAYMLMSVCSRALALCLPPASTASGMRLCVYRAGCAPAPCKATQLLCYQRVPVCCHMWWRPGQCELVFVCRCVPVVQLRLWCQHPWLTTAP